MLALWRKRNKYLKPGFMKMKRNCSDIPVWFGLAICKLHWRAGRIALVPQPAKLEFNILNFSNWFNLDPK